MKAYPRVAFLPDTFAEVNGVAHTARHLEVFARRRQIPFLSVHCGPKTEKLRDGVVEIVQLQRGPARVGLDANLDYDVLLMRYARRIVAEVKSFDADLIHITGPGDVGTLGAYVSAVLDLPLVISWQTSLHEYAGTRLRRLLSFMGAQISGRAGDWAEYLSIQILRWFYGRAVVTMAPNQELIDLTHGLTGKPSYLMRRGVDTQLFCPARRNRTGRSFRIGYVGRLTPEKNVRFLAVLAAALLAKGRRDFEFVIVGEGSEERWLRARVPNATFTGILRGAALAEAYANMDLFVFPSETDTFGNVVLEAMASGVPAVVTNQGGPKFLVQPGVNGYVAASEAGFIAAVEKVSTDPIVLGRMRQVAVEYALMQSWDTVFESTYRVYGEAVQLHTAARAAAISGQNNGRFPAQARAEPRA